MELFKGKKIRTGLLIGLAIVAVVIIITISLPRFFQTLELKTYDMRYSLRVGPPGEEDIDDIVLVDIDDASLAQLGRFQNWPRLFHAMVIDSIAKGGASAICFDIYFVESDSLRPQMMDIYQEFKSDVIAAELARLKGVKLPVEEVPAVINTVLKNWGYDREFGRSAWEADNVYFPLIFVSSGIGDTLGVADSLISNQAYLFDTASTLAFSFFRGDEVSSPELYIPVNQLRAASRGVGYYNVFPDQDGVVRRQPLFVSYHGRCYPSMDLTVVLDKLGIPKDSVSVVPGKYIQLGSKRRVPLDEASRMLITYFGHFKKFRYISYADVLTGRVPKEYFKDKIVIVGTSAAGLMDLRVVPFLQAFPGPEVHANIMYTLLSGKYVKAVPWHFELAILIVFGLITVLLSLGLRPVQAFLALIGLALAYFVFSIVIFNMQLVWIEMVRPLTVMIFTNMAILGYRYLTEEKQKLWIKNMFQGYMSKDLVDKIMANPELLAVGGERKEITVFFSDIKGFSSFSEKLGTPERLIALINEYLGAMSDVVLEHGGYISKYEGDAIMAFWGAPTDDPRHAETCIECVWAMNQRLQVLNAGLAARSMPNLFTRFGINTGQVTVGNVGSERKKSFTAMGDSVNLGSRLEGANKEYGTAIMISEFTYEKVPGKYQTRELDMLRVVGKEQPVRVFEVMGLTEADVPENKRKAVAVYLQGLEAYRAKQWDQAIALFKQALAADPDDGPSKAYVERCEEYKVAPPAADWDGVFVMKTK